MYVPLRWKNGQWEVRPCPYTEDPTRRANCQAWLDSHKELPKPKRIPLDWVAFEFGDKTMQGEVRCVDLAYENDQIFHNGIYYTIYANGHARWVNETCLKGT